MVSELPVAGIGILATLVMQVSGIPIPDTITNAGIGNSDSRYNNQCVISAHVY